VRLERFKARVAAPRKVDVKALLRELAEVRERGYAISSYSPGETSVAAAVMARDGRAVAALSVSAPAERLTAKKKAAIIECVLNACAHMSERASL
jgi:IclR family acetate operon transcriptional repressor